MCYQNGLISPLPLQAVKVITTMLPKIDSAIIPDITRGAVSLPNTSEKNRVAMSRFAFSRWSNETAHNYKVFSSYSAVITIGANLHMPHSLE